MPFDRTNINKHYKLTNINNNGYEHMLCGEVNWETIMNSLCPVSLTRWLVSQASVVKTFPWKNMSRSFEA